MNKEQLKEIIRIEETNYMCVKLTQHKSEEDYKLCVRKFENLFLTSHERLKSILHEGYKE